ncbi:hypothetical protein CIHG_08995 [Coccidioides immitis H538.4]|uniref:Uncharacterized protein n=1 Tax=Coccidioides immitis H538.4 TaxID=396776 RepID=A0A0J8S0X1_COCIT|nr:hypothetical protein CIHG_08995 [Coccidioides immitis H538.4]
MSYFQLRSETDVYFDDAPPRPSHQHINKPTMAESGQCHIIKENHAFPEKTPRQGKSRNNKTRNPAAEELDSTAASTTSLKALFFAFYQSRPAFSAYSLARNNPGTYINANGSFGACPRDSEIRSRCAQESERGWPNERLPSGWHL